jgi:predicted dehydrogenase
LYPRVDDQSTIILEYPGAQAVIQASWDWPYSRKDVHVYGRNGVIRTLDETRLTVQLGRVPPPQTMEAPALPPPLDESAAWFREVIRGRIDPAGSLSSLDNNLIAAEIMDAAAQSIASGRRVRLSPVP